MTIELEVLAGGAVPQWLFALLDRVAETALRLEGVELALVGVRLVDDAAIREINRDARGVDRPTDVLSFPSVRYPRGTAKDNLTRIRREYDPDTGRAYLGDVVISIERARAQAAEYGHSEARELGFLMAHAAMHLMGYDHMNAEDEALMREMEERVMAEVGLKRDYDEPWMDELFSLACAALENAYAPYSRFRVGACLLSEDGRRFQGCNVENASYGSTICAERAAVCRAVAEGATKFTAIAIAGEKAQAWPCGMCRQVLNEFGPDMLVLVGQKGGEYQTARLNELLPHAFGPKDLS